MKKVCRKCRAEKPIEEMKRDKKSRDGHASICKACDAERRMMCRVQWRLWYHRICEGVVCGVCGEKRLWVIDWHHTNPEEKEEDVMTMVRNTAPKVKILAEIQKCIPLCANCHRDLHWKEDNSTLSRQILERISLLS